MFTFIFRNMWSQGPIEKAFQAAKLVILHMVQFTPKLSKHYSQIFSTGKQQSTGEMWIQTERMLTELHITALYTSHNLGCGQTQQRLPTSTLVIFPK